MPLVSRCLHVFVTSPVLITDFICLFFELACESVAFHGTIVVIPRSRPTCCCSRPEFLLAHTSENWAREAKGNEGELKENEGTALFRVPGSIFNLGLGILLSPKRIDLQMFRFSKLGQVLELTNRSIREGAWTCHSRFCFAHFGLVFQCFFLHLLKMQLRTPVRLLSGICVLQNAVEDRDCSEASEDFILQREKGIADGQITGETTPPEAPPRFCPGWSRQQSKPGVDECWYSEAPEVFRETARS